MSELIVIRGGGPASSRAPSRSPSSPPPGTVQAQYIHTQALLLGEMDQARVERSGKGQNTRGGLAFRLTG